MNCPNCQQVMKIVKTPSLNLGFFVEFNQCPSCGGLWFNRFEMTQISNEEAFKIDSLDAEILKNSVPIKENLFCPIDNLPLLRLVDFSIPLDTHISRCRKCEGVWMNRGELAHYKQHIRQRQKENTYKLKVPEIDQNRLSKEAEQKVIASIGGQLLPMPLSLVADKSYPRDPFIISDAGVELLKSLPQDKKVEIYRLMARDHNEDEEQEERFINGTINILNIILRLLVRL